MLGLHYDSPVLVVHALWVEGRLGLWAEDPSLPARRGRRHPFAVAGLNLDGDTGIPAERSLTLPSRGARPEASPAVTEKAELKAWLVETVEYTPGNALGLLSGLAGITGDDIALAETTRWFAGLSAFAAGLVARGRLLPAIVGAEAWWLPVLTGRDAAHARALALALPPACVL
jgi:hypothetical protein